MRLGKITGSVSSPLLVKGKRTDELGAGAITLAYQLAGEILTGVSVREFKGNKHTEHGNEYEPIAREEYDEAFWRTTKEVGFIERVEENGKVYIGCSPDGLVGEKGGSEIKCLRIDNHLKIADLFKNDAPIYSDDKKVKGIIDKPYFSQIQYNLFVTNRDWWDIIFFHPDCNKNRLLVKRVERNDEIINTFSVKTPKLITEIERIVSLER